MSDLFHEDVSFEFIRQVLTVIDDNPQHIFQVLTKRPKRVLAFLNWYLHSIDADGYVFPANMWMGVTVENTYQAHERVPLLIEMPVSLRFVSCEPLLEAVSLVHYRDHIDWLIVGGETGEQARAMDPEWVRLLRDTFFGKAFFFKQWGSWAPDEKGHMRFVGRKKIRELDSLIWDSFPQAVQRVA